MNRSSRKLANSAQIMANKNIKLKNKSLSDATVANENEIN